MDASIQTMIAWMRKFSILFMSCLASSAWAQPQIAGCPVFPSDNAWNTPIDGLPLAANSSALINTIGATRYVHADFGSGTWNGGPIGIPFVVVAGTQPRVAVSFSYAGESDAGPYPIPPNPPIEGGASSTGDRHILMLDRDNCVLYELFYAYPQPKGSWTAGSGAIFNLRSNALRPDTWTSADAAGLPILPGLVQYDEVASGEIRHAIRFTAPQTRRAYVWPARHHASSITDPNYPPMGQRFRLRASFDISTYSPQVQVILRAMKKYGIILADNGGSGSQWFIGGAPDERWNNDTLRELHRIVGNDMEAVDVTSLIIDPNSGQSRGTNSIDLTTTVSSVVGGTSVQGSVRLSQAAPAGGAVVALFTSNAAAAQPPPTVIVPAGATTAAFSITTSIVSIAASATITATYLGAIDTALLTVNPSVNATPRPVSVTPNKGRGMRQTFSLVYEDVDGATDLAIVQAAFNPTNTKSCWIRYDRALNQLTLANATAPLVSTYCKIDPASVNVSTAGNRLTLTVTVTFSRALTGMRYIYGAAEDIKHASSGWVQLGSWAVR